MPAKKRKRTGPSGRPAAGQVRRPAQNRPSRPPLEVSGGRRPELYDYQNPAPSYHVGGGYRDNTVQFPTGQTRPSGQRPRPSGQRPRLAGSGRPQQARPVRRRPAQTVQRREVRRRRKVTRKMLRRRRMLRRLTAMALVLCVAAAGIYLTMTMLFKINAIQVRTADGSALDQSSPYTSDEILEVLGVQLEENIFSFDPAAKAAALEKAFPLLEHIAVERVYPSTVVVQVTPATPVYAMPAPGGWITLSADLKILAAETDQPDLPVLYGGDPVSTTPGDQLSYVPAGTADSAGSGASGAASSQAAAPQADSRVQALQTLLDALKERDLLADVTRVEFADVEQLAFLYQDRISVLLGTLNELDYKLDYAEYMLLNKEGKGCAPTDTGRLDCSHLRTDGSLQAIFAQGSPTLPSGYVVPEEDMTGTEQPAAGTEAEDPGTDVVPADVPEDGGEAGADAAAAPGQETQPAGAQQEEEG